jgi:hypothetical protein
MPGGEKRNENPDVIVQQLVESAVACCVFSLDRVDAPTNLCRHVDTTIETANIAIGSRRLFRIRLVPEK